MRRATLRLLLCVLCALGGAPPLRADNVVILAPGVHKVAGKVAPLDVRIPGEYRALKRWETLVTNVEGNAVNVHANAKLVGLQICFADFFGIQAQAKGVTLTLEDCWIHHMGCTGVSWSYSGGKLTMRRCLVEYCGSDWQHHHGLDARDCEVDIQECIFRDAACFPVQFYPSRGTFSRNLVTSSGRGSYFQGSLTLERNTVVGLIQGDSALLAQFAAGNAQRNLTSPWVYPWGGPFLCPWRGLYMPTGDQAGRGCYRFDPTHNLTWAAAQWPPLGVMSSVDRKPFTPAWPDN